MKHYRPTWLYIIKLFGLIVLAAMSIFIFSIFFDIVGYFVKSSLFEKIIAIVLNIVLVIAAYFIIKANNLKVKIGEDTMIIGHQTVPYDQIEYFFPAKGGSEPYIITKEGIKIDLEISWFSKKDRIEIKNSILEKIKLPQKI